MAAVTSAVVAAGAAAYGAKSSKDAAKKSAQATKYASDAGIAEQQAARQAFEQRTNPFLSLGYSASDPIAQMLGLNPQPIPTYQQPQTSQQPGGAIEAVLQASGVYDGRQGLFNRPQTSLPVSGSAQEALQILNGKVGPGLPQEQLVGNTMVGSGQRLQTGSNPILQVLQNRVLGQTGTAPNPRDLLPQTTDFSGLASQAQNLQSDPSSAIDFLRNQGVNPISVNNPLLGQIQQRAMNATENPLLADLESTARGEQGLEQINPIVNFIRDQGMTDIQNRFAAQGKSQLPTAKALLEYNNNLASTIVPQLQNQRFNQLQGAIGTRSQQDQTGFNQLLNALGAQTGREGLAFDQSLGLTGAGANLNQQQFGQGLSSLGLQGDLMNQGFNQGLNRFTAGSSLQNQELNQLLGVLGAGSDLQNQRFSQLFNVLGLGANAATGQGTAGLNTASNIGNLLSQAGAAQGDRYINQANATNNLIGNLAGIYGAYKGGYFG